MEKYALHGHFNAKEGTREQLVDILMKASELMQGAAGCHLYVVSVDPQQASTVWVTEIWDSKADHDHSLNLPGVKELIAQAIPLLEGMPQKGQELEVRGGLGLG